MNFPNILDRFLSYVKIDTQSDEESESFPSTKKQFDLLNKLKSELNDMNLDDVNLDKWGYLTATLKTNQKEKMPTIALIGHVDTSPDVSGKDVKPLIHKNYNGKDIVINRDENVILKISETPELSKKTGKTIITSDGTTLLGADDKAGVSEIMCAINYLVNNPDSPRPNIRILFTPDEEVGRGTEHITTEQINADYGYTLDGEKLGEIEDETFCADTVEIHITGIMVHPGYAKGKLVNAIKVAGAIIDSFPKNSLSPETTEKREGYIHPFTISGGGEKVILKILIRDFEESGLKEKEIYIKNTVDEVLKKFKGAKAEIKEIESYRNMKIILDKYPQVTKKAVDAIKLSGIEPKKNIIRGGTDGARLSFMGLPTPNIFTGGSNFHSRYEWITLEDMKKASEVIVNLMKLWTE